MEKLKHPNKCLRVRQTEYIKNGGGAEKHLQWTPQDKGQEAEGWTGG